MSTRRVCPRLHSAPSVTMANPSATSLRVDLDNIDVLLWGHLTTDFGILLTTTMPTQIASRKARGLDTAAYSDSSNSLSAGLFDTRA